LGRPHSSEKRWFLSEESFEQILSWLDPVRERAERKYEYIYTKLIKFFVCRGCTQAEDIAAETIKRVANKLPQLAESYVGEPFQYFYGIARIVWLEHMKERPK
jgi:DNA-directed RNA polymerase specialized sigma24 family protein